jgi:proteasome accessory factor C
MDRFDRIYDLHKLLSSSRYPVSREKIEQQLECSRATAKRIIESMRLYLDAPIKYDRNLNGYYYDRKQENLYELPGLWFNASELHALLSVQQLLTSVQPGLFDKQLEPLLKRIDKLLEVQQGSGPPDNLTSRVRILQIAHRASNNAFQQVAGATVQQKRLSIDYFNRTRNETDSREISPQRLIHYRDNWYLDAWCHKRKALRTFALDAIENAHVLKTDAKTLDEQTLDAYFGSAYGIFSGQADKFATLVFSEKLSRWVSREQWHPDQQGEFLEDGRFQLKLPFNNPTELIMDILRYGPEVEVVDPADLRDAVVNQLDQALARYR